MAKKETGRVRRKLDRSVCLGKATRGRYQPDFEKYGGR